MDKQASATVFHLRFPAGTSKEEVHEKCYVCLHRHLETRWHLTEREMEIARDKDGKPYLAHHPNVHFNISHSGTEALVAIANRPVGVDIEAVKADSDLRLARRIFSEEDYDAFVCGGATPQALAEAWVQKEAALKLSGEGIRGDFKQAAQKGKTVLLPVGDKYRAALCAAEDMDVLVRREDG